MPATSPRITPPATASPRLGLPPGPNGTVVGGNIRQFRAGLLNAVVAESMRLFPPVYVIGREATSDLELGGYRVKRGYTVLMSQWVNHRDPKYFPGPEEFRPERWQDGLAKRLPKFAYYPFGGGQRICVGNMFALLEAAVILAAVGQRYRFTLDRNAVIDIKRQITLLPASGVPRIVSAEA
jgi:cytochrome P450